MSDSDMLDSLITYLFREDILAHPMPPQRAVQLMQTIHCLLLEAPADLQITKERGHTHGQAENDRAGDPGTGERPQCPK